MSSYLRIVKTTKKRSDSMSEEITSRLEYLERKVEELLLRVDNIEKEIDSIKTEIWLIQRR